MTFLLSSSWLLKLHGIKGRRHRTSYDLFKPYFLPQVVAKLRGKMTEHFATHIKIGVNLEAVVTVISGFDIQARLMAHFPLY